MGKAPSTKKHALRYVLVRCAQRTSHERLCDEARVRFLSRFYADADEKIDAPIYYTDGTPQARHTLSRLVSGSAATRTWSDKMLVWLNSMNGTQPIVIVADEPFICAKMQRDLAMSMPVIPLLSMYTYDVFKDGTTPPHVHALIDKQLCPDAVYWEIVST